MSDPSYPADVHESDDDPRSPFFNCDFVCPECGDACHDLETHRCEDTEDGFDSEE